MGLRRSSAPVRYLLTAQSVDTVLDSRTLTLRKSAGCLVSHLNYTRRPLSHLRTLRRIMRPHPALNHRQPMGRQAVGSPIGCKITPAARPVTSWLRDRRCAGVFRVAQRAQAEL